MEPVPLRCAFLVCFIPLGCLTEPDLEENKEQEQIEALEEQTETWEERILLHEMFTGSNCGPCQPADEKLLAVLHDNPGEYHLISYQIGSDPYLTSEGVQRRMGYLPDDASSYAIPYLHVDGVNELHPHLVNDEEGYLQADFDSFQALTPLSMEVSATVTGQTVEIEGSYTGLDEVASEDLRLHIAILEKVTYNNVGSNGQTEFHHVMKKMVPDLDGDAVDPIAKGDITEFEASYTFQGEYDPSTGIQNPLNHALAHTVEEFEDLEVLAWIQDSVTWQVYQSAASE